MSQRKSKNRKELRKGFLVLAILLYAFGIFIAVATSLQTPISFIIMAVGIPTLLLLLFIVFVLFVKYWFKFWYWWLPNWLSFGIGLPQWQSVVVYIVILILLGFILVPIFVSFLGTDSIVNVVIFYSVINILSIWRVWLVFTRYIGDEHKFMITLGVGEKPTRQQVLSYPGKSENDVKKILTYKRFALKSPELPEYDSLEAQLYACIQSYASLQQGNDIEDARLDRSFRAAVMSQYISLAASNLRHIFLVSELRFTHIVRVRNLGEDGSTAAVFGYIVYANLSEAVVGFRDVERPKMRAINTPFYIEGIIVGGQPYIQKIEIQESPIERSLIRTEISAFAEASHLLYVPRLAPALQPKAGLLASSGLLRKWSLASNFLTGHTEHHAYYFLSIQPYLRLNRNSSYVIGCTVVPKTHDRIIVADKRSGLYQHAKLLPIQRISTESSDFSARFGIFIGQESTVPSLELLNPRFMQLLLDTPYEVSIEVIGRQIYVYIPTKHITIMDFSSVLALMQGAHKQLRL